MVYTPRKPVYKKRVYKRRAPMRKRTTMSRKPTLNTIHTFKRMLQGNFATWATGATNAQCSRILGNAVHAPWLGAFTINGLNSVINTSEFQALFDQYRIDKLVLKFFLKVDPGAQTAATANVPRLYFYRDYDDSVAPASLDDLRENQKCQVRVLSLYKPVTVVCKPNCLQLIYQSALANQFKPVFSQWMDIATPNTTHFTHKYAIDDLTNTNYRVDVEGTLYFSTRQSR